MTVAVTVHTADQASREVYSKLCSQRDKYEHERDEERRERERLEKEVEKVAPLPSRSQLLP